LQVFGAVGKRYKLFRCGCEEKTEKTGVFEQWVDSVIQTARENCDSEVGYTLCSEKTPT